MVFLDSIIPMYLLGSEHPNKALASAELSRLISSRERLVTDAAVYAELLDRYTEIGRRDMIQPAFDVLSAMVDEVIPIDAQRIIAAKALVLAYPSVSAKDAMHVATMQENEIRQILTFNVGYDVIPDIQRIPS